jgi:hypothetical protein
MEVAALSTISATCHDLENNAYEYSALSFLSFVERTEGT